MIERRPFDELPSEDLGWLKARRHFSSAAEDDPSRSGWGCMRVWNDEEIAPNAGFALQAHANIEIITYVREGTVTHRDSLGNEGRIEAGNVQVVSAGTGIRHAEYNLEQAPARIFQMWITPASSGGSPAWGVQPCPMAERSGCFVAIASGFDSDERRTAHSRLRPRAERQAEGRRVYRICASRTAACLPGAVVGSR